MWELRDEVTNKVVYVGTEEECIEYSKKHPEINFLMVEVKSQKNQNKM